MRIIKPLEPGWEMPEGIDIEGEVAVRVIRQFAEQHGLGYTGGGRVFYSPAEWARRGEEYALKSVLIVNYGDGKAIGEALDYDRAMDDGYKALEALNVALEGVGLFSESATSWYSGIYKIGGKG